MRQPTFLFETGEHVEDTITGIKGMITGRCEHITGCNTYGVKPKGATEKGKPFEANWFDENTLKLQSKPKFKLPGSSNRQPKKPKARSYGGPSENPSI